MKVLITTPIYIAYILASFFIISFLKKFCPYVWYKKNEYITFIEVKYI